MTGGRYILNTTAFLKLHFFQIPDKTIVCLVFFATLTNKQGREERLRSHVCIAFPCSTCSTSTTPTILVNKIFAKLDRAFFYDHRLENRCKWPISFSQQTNLLSMIANLWQAPKLAESRRNFLPNPTFSKRVTALLPPPLRSLCSSSCIVPLSFCCYWATLVECSASA